MREQAYTLRINQGGNYCGHDRVHPQFTLAKPVKVGKGGIPQVLSKCMERLKGYYDNPRHLLPSLNLANGSDRQQRSERREACIRLLACLLKFTELSKLQVGIPTREGFVNLTVDLLARHTGIGLRRTERALHDLKAAGLITITSQASLVNGVWKGFAAIKTISRTLFKAFGLAVALRFECKKAAKRLREKEEKWQQEKEKLLHQVTETEKARYQLFMQSMAQQIKPSTSAMKPRIKRDTTQMKKELMLKALALKREHPHWSRDKCMSVAGV